MFILPKIWLMSPIQTTYRWAGTLSRIYSSFTYLSLSISYVDYDLSNNFCATPFRNSRHTLKSPFFNVSSLSEAQRMSRSVKTISISVTLCTQANLSFMISPSCSAVQGEKMTFSMSCILKQNLLEDFSSVSMVLEMPIRMRRSPFFWKSFMKSSVMGVGSALKSSYISSMQTTQAWSYWASYSMLTSLGAVQEIPPFSCSSSLPMSSCTSWRVRTTLAFIFMILQPCLASSECTVRLFPAPGEPVSIRNRTPFFSSRTHNYRNSAIRSVSLSLKRNWEGMRVPDSS